MIKDAVSLQGKRCSPMRTSILLLLALLTTNGPATAQDACLPPIPMPTVDKLEVQNLWQDIRVQEAQAVLCSTTPGEGQVLGIIDRFFRDLPTYDDHGSYTSQIAAGNPDGTGHGYGLTELPGIAAGAVRWEESFQSWWDDSYQRCVNRVPPLLAFDCFRRTDRKFVDLMTEAFSHVAAQTGPEAAIGFTMTTLLDHPVELLIRPTRRQVRSMLDVFQSYTEHGIVVLPANFFDRPVANLPETRSGLKSSRALVVHQILRGDTLEYDEKNCDPEIEQCATMPYAIDLVVPTTNGNNSVVVPAVLGTIALMKNANPSLTNEEIMAILTDPAYFSATVTVGRRTVPVLDALEAVNAARPSEILVPILQGSDDAGPDPGLGCSNFTDRNEVYFAKCLNGQTDVTSGFRFIDLPIPRGARILDAHIEFTVDGPYDNEIQLEIIGEKKTLAGTFGPGSWPSQRAVLTNASVAWTIAASDIWDMGQTRTTPNLSAILQEIVNLRRWNLVNNGVVILVRNAGPAEIGPHREYHRRVFAFERDPARAARLVVRFVQVAPVKFSYFYSFGDLSGTNSMMPGDIFTIWDQPWGGSIFNDTAQCLTNNRGQIRAYNHDRLSEDGPGTLGQWKSQGCSTAEEFGYVVECCVVP